MVRRYGARRFFFMGQLNPRRKKRLFYGLPPYSMVRCGAFFFFVDSPTVWCGAFVFLTVQCGADCFFLESHGAVRCGFVRGKIVPYRAVRFNPHAPSEKNAPLKALPIVGHRSDPTRVFLENYRARERAEGAGMKGDSQDASQIQPSTSGQ